MLASRLLISAAAVACLALPAAASADVASFDGTTVTLQGTDGNETVTLAVQEAGYVQINANSAGPGCTYNDALQYANCPIGSGGIQVNTGGGADTVSALDLSTGSIGDGLLRVDLGTGDDKFQGGAGGETVNGGPGNDELSGRGGDDHFDGGDGNDKLIGDGGHDALLGGNGDDFFDGDHFNGVGGDLIDGGPGADRAEGWADPSTDAEHPPISITLDGVANDGRPGEGDDVRSIERITSNISGTLVLSDEADIVEMWANIDNGPSTIRSNGGNDQVTGGSRDETIDGGAGDDRLEGGFGNDTITGGPGRDTINADMSASQCGVFQSCTVPFGNDTIDVRDGEADTVVCGPGTDTVKADAVDTLGPDCETTDKAGAGPAPGPGTKPGAGGAGGTGAQRLTLTIAGVSRAAALKRGLPVTVAVPGAGRLSAAAREGRRTVATGSAKAKAAGKVTLRLKVGKKGRKALRRHGRHKLVVKVTFTPAKGKATTVSRALTVR